MAITVILPGWTWFKRMCHEWAVSAWRLLLYSIFGRWKGYGAVCFIAFFSPTGSGIGVSARISSAFGTSVGAADLRFAFMVFFLPENSRLGVFLFFGMKRAHWSLVTEANGSW